MQKTNKAILGFIAFGIIGLLGVGTVMATTQVDTNTNFSNKRMHAPKIETLQQRQDIAQALNTGNYSAWVAAVKEGGKQPAILSKINESNFHTYVDFLNLLKSKDFKNAKNLANELGLRFGQHNTNGHHAAPQFWKSLKPVLNASTN